jgi:hypothetical protein
MHSMRKPTARQTMAVLVGLLVAAQLVPIRHDNPPAGAGPAMPAPVAAIIKRSCSDCHTNETIWPWYSHVAPVSWLVARDTTQGRRHLNFSEWSSYRPDQQRKLMKDIVEQVQGGDMPLWFYVPLHRAARLSPDDVKTLTAWASAAGGS